MPNLKILDLSGTKLDNTGAIQFGKALGELKSIEKLVLTYCNIGNKGLQALLEGLYSKRLHYLYRCDNKWESVPIIDY